MSGQTVFVPFRYCPLCRLNHKKGKKHIFSKRHQDTVASVLTKFSKKISEATEFLKKPSVKDITWDQADVKFWCYFCQDDVKKHRLSTTIFGDCVIEYGGLLEHITRDDHVKNTVTFLKENKLDMKRTTEFIISPKVYLKYLEDVESSYTQFFLQKSQALNQVASQIRSQSMIRQDIVAGNIREQSLLKQDRQQQLYTSGGQTRWSKPVGILGSEERGKKTVQAFGEGLTAIDRPDEDDNAGNIYTNALPPWMQPDQDSEVSTGVIGPTMEDLEKHQKLERKKQLPACRVGAKFDRKSDDTEQWLPDFGGVWNHGRRTNSVQQFMRRQSKKIGGSLQPSGLWDSNSATSFVASSYSFPKIPKRTSTVTSRSGILANSNSGQCETESPDVQTDSLSSGNSFPQGTSSITRNSDFFFNEDLQAAKSHSSTSVAEMTGPVYNSSQLVSSFVDADSFVTVKPYVRKRSAPAMVSGQILPSYKIPVPYQAQIDTLHTGSMFQAHNSYTTSEQLPPPFQPFENHISSVDCDGKLDSPGVVYPIQKYNRHGSKSSTDGRELNLQSDTSFRLITTPVLNQQMSRFPNRKSFKAEKS